MTIRNLFGTIDQNNNDRGTSFFLGRFDVFDIKDDMNAIERFLINLDDHEYKNVHLYHLTDKEMKSIEGEEDARMGGSPFNETADEMKVSKVKGSDELVDRVITWLDDARIVEAELRDYLYKWIPGGDSNEELDNTLTEMYVLSSLGNPVYAVRGVVKRWLPAYDSRHFIVPVNKVVSGAASKGVTMNRLPKFIVKDRDGKGWVNGCTWFAEYDDIEFFGKTQKEVRLSIDAYHAGQK